MPGDQQQHRGADDLLRAHLAAGEHPADQVVLGLTPTLGDQLAEVVPQLLAEGPGLLRLGVEVDHLRGPGLEELVIGVRHAEQLADHQRGHRQRERRDQVRGVARGQHVLDQPVHDLLDARAHLLQAGHGELRDQQLAEPAVLGRVHADEAAGDELLIGVGVPRVAGVGAEPGIDQHLPHLGVPGDQPDLAHPGMLGLHGTPFPQLAIRLGRAVRARPEHWKARHLLRSPRW